MKINVLAIGSDRGIFQGGSSVRKRILEYGGLFNELHIIIFANRRDGFRDIKLGNNIFVYPTNHRFKIFYLWSILRIAKGVFGKREQFVITAQDPFWSGIAGWMLKFIYGAPLQIQVHTDLFSPMFYRGVSKRIQVFVAKVLLKKADEIRVVSKRVAQSFERAGLYLKNKVDILPIFTEINFSSGTDDYNFLRHNYPNFNFIILMVSRLEQEKNIFLALSAMKEIVKKHPGTLLVVVGSGSEEKNLKDFVSTSGLGENVRFESWVDDVAKYYMSADLFVLASDFEGYGLSVAEAMGAGIPVVMTDVGLAGEVALHDKNSLVVPVGNLTKLIEAIDLMISDLVKRKELADSGKKTAELFMEKGEYLLKYRELLEELRK